MGAWGAGPFENDEAQDFLDEFSRLRSAELETQLWSVLALPAGGYLSLPQACAAIAAAALIAVARGATFDDIGQEAVKIAQSDGMISDARLRRLALSALARVNSESSEWRELWSESPAWDQADEMIADLQAQLT